MPLSVANADNAIIAASVYPNPSSGLITIAGAAGSHMTISSFIGNTVRVGQVVSSQELIDISTLPSGIYIPALRRAAGIVTAQRLIKE